MGTVPVITNKVATVLNKFLQILTTVGDDAAEAYLTSLDPAILGLPVIRDLLDLGVSDIGMAVYNFLAVLSTNLVIEIQTNGEESKVVSSGTALEFAEASGDATATKAALQNYIQSIASLVHWDGTAIT
jgi:hypothetical protein